MSVRRVRITLELLSRFVTGKFRLFRTDLPEDARIVGVLEDRDLRFPNTLILFLESKQYPPIPEGELIPEVMITCTLENPNL